MFGRPVVSCHRHKASYIITTRTTIISSLVQQNIITGHGFSTRNTQTTCLESSTVQKHSKSARERERYHSNAIQIEREGRERVERERKRESPGEIVQM